MYFNFGQSEVGSQTAELDALVHLKYPYRLIMGKMVFPLFLVVYLAENYLKYFDDYICWLSDERSLAFGLLVIFLFVVTAAVVVSCGGPKKQPRASFIVQSLVL